MIRRYADRMALVVFAAIFEGPEREGFKKGYGEAMLSVQRKLLEILDD